jgi:LacI family transcriptional regulator
VIGDVTNPLFSEVARGVQDAAQAKGYNEILCNSDSQPQQEQRILETLSAQGADGIIIFPAAANEQWLASFAGHHHPIVAINHPIAHPNISLVIVNHYRGTQLAVNYLVDNGHTEIGMLTGSQQGQRVQGFRETLAARGLPVVEDRIVISPPQIADGHKVARQLLTQHPEITAIFTYNDLLAVGAIRACQELGRSVPADCAIIGFDDILLASLVTPTLTTIRTDKYDLGQQAFRQLLVMLDNPNTTFPPVQLEVDLIIRESA